MALKKLLTRDAFKHAISNGVTLVDFNAQWCAPCRLQEPILTQLAEQFKDKALITEINIDDQQETAAELNIQSIPTLTLFRDGKEIERFVGLQPQATLAAAIENALK